jgi:hypothetical protein
MLTLNFSTHHNGDYYFKAGENLLELPLRFSNSINERPFMTSYVFDEYEASSFLHNGRINVSERNPFSGRMVNTVKFSEILEKSPALIKVTLGAHHCFVGKYCIIRTDNHFTYDTEICRILFMATYDKTKRVSSGSDLKVYIDRVLYEDENYKRILSIIKPIVKDHKGDSLIVRDIGEYLLYRFSIPALKTIKDRLKFNENIKELFYMDIKWAKLRREKEEEQLKLNEIELRKKRDERNRQFYINETLAELNRLSNPVNLQLPSVSEQPPPQHVDTLVGDEPMSIQASDTYTYIGPDSGNITTGAGSAITADVRTIGVMNDNSTNIRIYDYPITPENSMNIGMVSNPALDQPTNAEEIPTTNSNPNSANPASQVEHVDEGEIMRIMNEFSIAQTPPEYSVGYDPISGVESNSVSRVSTIPTGTSPTAEGLREELRIFRERIDRAEANLEADLEMDDDFDEEYTDGEMEEGEEIEMEMELEIEEEAAAQDEEIITSETEVVLDDSAENEENHEDELHEQLLDDDPDQYADAEYVDAEIVDDNEATIDDHSETSDAEIENIRYVIGTMRID